MTHLIVAAADRKVESFVVDQWLASLLATTDLSNTDVLVIDYGFSPLVRARLDAAGVRRVERELTAQIGNQRFVDFADIVKDLDYDTALFCDCGDLVFQKDVAPLLREKRDRLAVYREPVVMRITQTFVNEDLLPEKRSELKKRFVREPTFNVGVVLGPIGEFRAFARYLQDNTVSLDRWGTEQVLMSAYCLEHGCDLLPYECNTIAFWARYHGHRIGVRRGTVLIDGEPVTIVHNVGRWDSARAFAKFGYGPGRNRLRSWLLRTTPLFIKVANGSRQR